MRHTNKYGEQNKLFDVMQSNHVMNKYVQDFYQNKFY